LVESELLSTELDTKVVLILSMLEIVTKKLSLLELVMYLLSVKDLNQLLLFAKMKVFISVLLKLNFTTNNPPKLNDLCFILCINQ
jgi:hypothetical protein